MRKVSSVNIGGRGSYFKFKYAAAVTANRPDHCPALDGWRDHDRPFERSMELTESLGVACRLDHHDDLAHVGVGAHIRIGVADLLEGEGVSDR